ncbi:MAG TPA: V-type ATPase subunit [Nitrososphaerales archaeon]|nr:V-type ATPase subunit [Nitrososphaerales archaeon]
MVDAMYAYANARVKAMQSDLFSQAKFESLVSTKDFGELTHELNLTVYKDDLATLAVKYSGADLLEAAIHRHLVRISKSILLLTPDDAKDVVSLILGRWDIRNITLIITSKALGYPLGQMTDVFLVSSTDYPLGPMAGVLSLYELKELADMKDVAGVVTWASKRYGGDFEVYLEKYRTDGDIGPLLLQLELTYLRKLILSVQGRSGADARVAAALKSYIDEKNIIALMKGKQRGVVAQDMQKYMVEGGNLSSSFLAEVYRGTNVEEIVDGIKQQYDLTEALPAYRQEGLVALENMLSRKIAQKSIASLRVAPPSLSSIVAYMMLKDLEIDNLVKIIRGKEYGVQDKEIRSSLVYA